MKVNTLKYIVPLKGKWGIIKEKKKKKKNILARLTTYTNTNLLFGAAKIKNTSLVAHISSIICVLFDLVGCVLYTIKCIIESGSVVHSF